MFRGLFQTWRDLFRVKSLPADARRLVFYSEGRAYGIYFQPILDALRPHWPGPVLYVTSDRDDPMLTQADPWLIAVHLGDGAARTAFFQTLEAVVVVMTMPDLETFHIKRSPRVGHYVYVHHALVSQHMVYRERAFDHFDVLMCAGPHHVRETRAREVQAGLPAKRVVEHGYGPVDLLMAGRPGPIERAGAPRHALVAPSWGPNSLLENVGERVCRSLLAAGLRVTLRPHPRSYTVNAVALERIATALEGGGRFSVDRAQDSRAAYRDADLMVSDWSGAALEFAFGLERPVIYIDTPRKVNNPDWAALGIEPIEASLRETLGVIVPPAEADAIGPRALALLGEAEHRRARIVAARDAWLFNPDRSGVAGAQVLLDLLAASDSLGKVSCR